MSNLRLGRRAGLAPACHTLVHRPPLSARKSNMACGSAVSGVWGEVMVEEIDASTPEDDERYNSEFRAATRRWWSGILIVELSTLIVAAGLTTLLGNSPIERNSLADFAAGAKQLAGLSSLIHSGDPDRTISILAILALLATLGIAATVALNSALDRTERLRNDFKSSVQPSPATIYETRFAELGEMATFVTTLTALILCHLLFVASVAAIRLDEEVSRSDSLVAATASTFMALLFLIECARLSAPFRTPVLTRPRGSDRRISERLRSSLARWREINTGRVVVGWGLSVLCIVTPAAWLLWPPMLGVGGGSSASRSTPAAIYLASIAVLAMIAFCMNRLATDALVETGLARFITVTMSIGMYLSGVLASAAAGVIAAGNGGSWNASNLQVAVAVLLWLGIAYLLMLRLLGWAGIGPKRGLGITFLLDGGQTRPPRFSQRIGKSTRRRTPHRQSTNRRTSAMVWVWLGGLAAISVVLAATAAVGVNLGTSDPISLGIPLVLVTIGGFALFVGLVSSAEFGRESQDGGLEFFIQWRSDRALQLVVIVLLVAVVLTAQVREGIWSLLLVPWAAWNCVLLGLGPYRMRTDSTGNHPLVSTLWQLGDHLVSMRILRRRRWIARKLAPDRDWDDRRVLRWLAELQRESTETLETNESSR